MDVVARLLLRFAFAIGLLAGARGLGLIDGSWLPGVVAAVFVTLIATFVRPKGDITQPGDH